MTICMICNKRAVITKQERCMTCYPLYLEARVQFLEKEEKQLNRLRRRAEYYTNMGGKLPQMFIDIL
jgi:hypothetical protein